MSSERSLYLNGNYVVRVIGNYRLIKRGLRVGEEFVSSFPDSIDLKITDKCSWGCPYCHESSTKDGKSFDLEKTKEILSQLPEEPIEIAIGGGDVLDAPDVLKLIEWLEERGNRTRATVNIKDVFNRRRDFNRLLNKVGAVGVSLDKLPPHNKILKNWDNSESLVCTILGAEEGNLVFARNSTNVVLHIIAGVFPYTELERLFDIASCPILILGYKQWGRAKDTALPKDLDKFKDTLFDIITKERNKDYESFISGRTVGFDNLALEQLDVKNHISENEWENLYMGDEGSHSMYIDAVKGEYAMTSRSAERVSWESIGLIDYFNSLKK